MDEEPERETLPPSAPPLAGKPKILLVDDSQFGLSQVARALGDEYETILASGGAEGLALLDRTSDVALVITDLLMPHISGLAFLGQARARHPSIKVIVSSADIQDGTAAKARALGAAAFVPKPVDPDELRRIVRLVLAHDVAPAELPISPRYTDAFREIFNIGIGRAASALSKMVFETVKLSVPRLDILRLRQLAATLGETFEGDLALVKQDFSGAAMGTAYLLMSKDAGLKLVNALVRQGDADAESFGEGDKALLTEVGNILINALVGSMGNMLGIQFELGQPSCQLAKSGVIQSDAKMKDSDFVLFVETLFLLPGRHIGGNLVILLGSSEMGAVLKGIDRVF
jgi:chemotaxis protein CheY-P-specific phosphatase CheC